MLGPIAVRLTADATGIEPIRVALDVFVVLVNVIDNEIHHHANATLVSGVDHGMEFVVRAQARFNAPSFRGPVPVEGRDVVHAIGCFTRSLRSGVEGCKPKRIDAQICKITGFNHARHACKVAALPVRTGGRSGGVPVVAFVPVDETIGHDHVNQGVLPNKRCVRSEPKGNQQVVRLMPVRVETFDLQGVLSVVKSIQ